MEEFYTSKLLSKYKVKLVENSESFNFKIEEPDKDKIDKDLALEATIISISETIEEMISILESDKDIIQLNEGVSQTFRKAKDSVSKTLVKFTLAEKQMSERINEKFNKYLQLYRDSKRNSTYDVVVKRAIDLSKMLKRVLTSFIIGILIPGGIQIKFITAIIALLIQVAIDKRTEKRYKNLILNDIKFELKVVQEKIKDAEARGDIKAKYKLMRIENQLGRAMDRIMYNIRY